jgi:murein DD-endopeptidase MepM/ murein hydrolase activator NlpD
VIALGALALALGCVVTVISLDRPVGGRASRRVASLAWPAAPDAAAVAAEATAEEEGTVIAPWDWMPDRGDECHEYRGLRICEGPRMVPRPHGPEAQLARQLGLGTRQVAQALLHEGPARDWVLAVRGEYSDELRWPVRGGRLWRGLLRGDPDGDGEESFPHHGVDIGGDLGAHIHAAADGLVAYSDNELSGYGNVMLVVHVDGAVALYGHCRANYVFAGQQVRAGQVIGEVGETGITRGAHLHFELRVDGEPVCPLPFFRRWLQGRPGPFGPGELAVLRHSCLRAREGYGGAAFDQ